MNEMALLTKYPQAVYTHLPEGRQKMGEKFIETINKLDQQDQQQALGLFNNLQQALPVKNYYMANTMYNSLKSSVLAQRNAIAQGKEPTGADDVAIVFSFMKTIEPNSTVREGEYATAQNTGGVGDKIIATYNSLMRGEKLTQEQRENFLAAGGRQMSGHVQAANMVRQQYLDQAKATGLKEGALAVPEFKVPEGIGADSAKTGSGASKDDPFVPQNDKERDEALKAGKWIGNGKGQVWHKDLVGGQLPTDPNAGKFEGGGGKFGGHGASGSWGEPQGQAPQAAPKTVPQARTGQPERWRPVAGESAPPYNHQLPMINTQDFMGPFPTPVWAQPQPQQQLKPGQVISDADMQRILQQIMRPQVTQPTIR